LKLKKLNISIQLDFIVLPNEKLVQLKQEKRTLNKTTPQTFK